MPPRRIIPTSLVIFAFSLSVWGTAIAQSPATVTPTLGFDRSTDTPGVAVSTLAGTARDATPVPALAPAMPERGSGRRDSTGGVWSELGPPCRSGAGLFVDPVAQTMILCGGGEAYPTPLLPVWVADLSGDSRWQPVVGHGDIPPALTGAVGALDVAHRRLFVTGYAAGDSVVRIWQLRLQGTPRWTELIVPGGPRVCQEAALAYDPVRDRLILYGGYHYLPDYTRVDYLDVWALSLGRDARWTRLAVAGTGPGARHGHALLYDPHRDRVLVTTSHDLMDTRGGDQPIFTLTLGALPAWGTLPAGFPSGGPDRLAYDPQADELMLVSDDGWTSAYSLASGTWRALCSFPGFDDRAFRRGNNRYGAALAVDPTHGLLIAYGGDWGGGFLTARGDAVALPLAGGNWAGFGPYIPGNRFWHQAVLDRARDRAIFYDRQTWLGDGIDPMVALSLRGSAGWSPLVGAGPSPEDRQRGAFAFDERNDRVLLFGGLTPGGRCLHDLWSLSQGRNPVWTRIEPEGSGPGPHYLATAIYDAKRDRLLVFGGDDRVRELRSVWEARISGARARWTQLVPNGQLPFSYGQPYVAPSGNEAWVVAPLASTDPPTLGLVRIDLSGPMTCAVAMPQGVAPEVNFQVLGFDSRRMRFLGFHSYCGGVPGSCSTADFSPLWSLPVEHPTWSTASTEGTLPLPRFLQAAVYDPDGDRLVMYGGYSDGSNYFGDTWALQFARGPRGERALASEAEDVAMLPLPALSLAGARPNPGVRGLSVAFSLPDAAPARLDVLDLAGRRIAGRDVGALGAGPHVVDLTAGRELPAGLYWLRLERGGRTLTAKAVVIR